MRRCADIFEENGQFGLPFNEAIGWADAGGLLTIDAIPKPIYRAYQLLHQAGERRCSVAATEAGASGEGDGMPGTLNALCTLSPSRGPVDGLGLRLFLSNWAFFGGQDKRGPLTVSLDIPLPPGAPRNVTATVSTIDSSHANPRAAWMAMGSPAMLSAAQKTALLDASEVGVAERPVVAPGHGSARLELTLEPDSFVAVFI